MKKFYSALTLMLVAVLFISCNETSTSISDDGSLFENKKPPPPSPIILDVSPSSAYRNTLVTITGSGFGPRQREGVLTINGVTTTVVEWKKDKIRGWVLWNTPSTVVKVSVTQSGATSNEVDLTVLQNLDEWTTTNLNVTTYRNGDEIPQVQDQTEWANLTTGAWCYYDNDPDNEAVYGKLYNWFAVNDSRGLAPEGYHLPEVTEVHDLMYDWGVYETSGGAMKATGTTYWSAPNLGATNASGLTALPGGFRKADGEFSSMGVFCTFWPGYPGWSDRDDIAAYSYFAHDETNFFYNYGFKKSGLSVRCVAD